MNRCTCHSKDLHSLRHSSQSCVIGGTAAHQVVSVGLLRQHGERCKQTAIAGKVTPHSTAPIPGEKIQDCLFPFFPRAWLEVGLHHSCRNLRRLSLPFAFKARDIDYYRQHFSLEYLFYQLKHFHVPSKTFKLSRLYCCLKVLHLSYCFS